MVNSKKPCIRVVTLDKTRPDLFAGLAIGFVSFVLAEVFVPKSVKQLSDHDLLLSIRLGLIYVPLTAIWFSYSNGQGYWFLCRRILIGLSIGLVYAALVNAYPNFPLVMLVLPSILSGTLLVLMRNASAFRAQPLAYLRRDLCSGGLAGFVLGLTHSVLLNLGLHVLILTKVLHEWDLYTAKYIEVMTFGGPLAFAPASALFFWLFRRAWTAGEQNNQSNALLDTIKLLPLFVTFALIFYGRQLVKLLLH